MREVEWGREVFYSVKIGSTVAIRPGGVSSRREDPGRLSYLGRSRCAISAPVREVLVRWTEADVQLYSQAVGDTV